MENFPRLYYNPTVKLLPSLQATFAFIMKTERCTYFEQLSFLDRNLVAIRKKLL